MSENKKIKKSKIGGQALIEGVMMRGLDKASLAVRKPDGSINLELEEVSSMINPKWYRRAPFVRGIFNFIESMVFGYKYLMRSAEISGSLEEDEDYEPGKFEQKLTRMFGDKLMTIVGGLSMVLGVGIAIGLFMFLPALVVKLLENLVTLGFWKSAVEGVIKIALFVLYLALISKMKDIQRVFQYHGAEHKSIACYEAGEELTPGNVKRFTRFHPRCGTSFLLIVLIISIIVFSVVSWDSLIIRVLLKIALLPVVVGIAYEIIRLAGKYENIVTKVISAPGIWLQRLTTREPDESQMEVAIEALKAVIPDNPDDDEI